MPRTRHAWISLATALYRFGGWQECLESARRAIALSDKPTSNADNRKSGRVDPHDLAAIAARHLGDGPAALRHAETALEQDPTNARLVHNVRLVGRLTIDRTNG